MATKEKKEEIFTAQAIKPLIRRLYKFGIIGIYGHNDQIQMTKDAFLDTFSTYYVDRNIRDDGYIEYHHKTELADFFCLVWDANKLEEEWHG